MQYIHDLNITALKDLARTLQIPGYTDYRSETRNQLAIDILRSYFDTAIESGDTSTVEFILADPKFIPEDRHSPLKVAVAKGYLEIVRLLLADLRFDPQEDLFLLTTQPDLLTLLLSDDRKADSSLASARPGSPTPDDDLPFHPASTYGNRQIISSGTYGQVYKSGSQAVKVQTYDANFLTEMAVLRQLKGYPYILDLVDVCFHGADGILVLPYVSITLWDRIKKPHTDLDVTHWMYQLMLGVSYIHSNDILHLDLKPQNILVDRGVLKIADFGSSRPNWCHIRPQERMLIKTTINYQSPQIVHRQPYADTDDLWAVGVIWYYLVAKTSLFVGTNEEITQAILQFKPEEALKEWLDIPLRSLLDLDPAKRILPYDAYYFDRIRSQYPEPTVIPCQERRMKLHYPGSYPRNISEGDIFAITEKIGGTKSYFDGCLYLQYLPSYNDQVFNLASVVGQTEVVYLYTPENVRRQRYIITALNGRLLATTAYDLVQRVTTISKFQLFLYRANQTVLVKFSQEKIAHACLSWFGYLPKTAEDVKIRKAMGLGTWWETVGEWLNVFG